MAVCIDSVATDPCQMQRCIRFLLAGQVLDYVCRNIDRHVREFRPNIFYFNKSNGTGFSEISIIQRSTLKKEICSLKIKDAGTLLCESLHVIVGNLTVRSR